MFKAIFYELAVILLTVIFTLFVLPILLIFILIPLQIYRQFIIILAKIIRPDLKNAVSSSTSLWTSSSVNEGTPLGVIGSIAFLEDPSLTREKLAKIIKEKIVSRVCPNNFSKLKYPELTHYTEDWALISFWKPEEKFQTENHVFYGEDHDSEVTEPEMNILFENVLREPFSPGKSPWRVLLYTNYRTTLEPEKKKCAVVFLIHHSIGDARGNEILILNELGEFANGDKVPNGVMTVREKTLSPYLYPFVASYQFVSQILNIGITENLWFFFNERDLLAERDIYYSPNVIKLPDLISVARKFRVDEDTVQVTIVGGALKNYMKKLKGPHAIIPDNLDLLYSFSHGDHPNTLNNFHSNLFYKLPIGEENQMEKLSLIQKEIDNLETSCLPTLNRILLKTIGSLPNPISRELFKIEPPSPMLIRVRAPRDPIFFQGKLVENLIFSNGVLPGSLGMSIFIVEYNGWIRFGVAVSKSLTNEDVRAEHLIEEIYKEFYRLLK